MTVLQTINPADAETSSAAALPENVALLGGEDELQQIAAVGPRGAMTVAGLAVALVLAIWTAFWAFIFLARGVVG